MPLVRMTTSVACDDLPSTRGAEVQLSPERAKQVVANGWGEIVRGRTAETPEDRATRPETTDATPRRGRPRKSTAAE